MPSAGQILWTIVLFIMAAGTAPGVIGSGLLDAQQPRAGGRPSLAQETGQFSSGGTIVWLRVEEDGSVLVFAAKGFRSAFAHPSVLTADETDHWADALATFIAADSAAGGRGGGDSAMIRVSFAGGDLTLEEQTLGQALALVARFGAAGPAPVSTVYHAIGLRPLIPTLRQTAQIARKVQATRRAEVATATPPAPPVSPAPAAGPAAPAGSPTTTLAAEHTGGSPPSSPAPASAAAAKPSTAAATTTPIAPAHQTAAAVPTTPKPPIPPPPAPVVSAPTKPTLVVPVSLGADSLAKVHTVTHSPISAKVETPGSGATHLPSAPRDSASTRIARSLANAPDSRIEYSAGQPLSLRIGPGSDPHSATAGTDSARSAPSSTGGGSSSKGSGSAGKDGKPSAHPDPDSPGDSIAETALSTEGRLPPSVLGDVIRQRQQLLQFCYTEFGLRKDPALAGQIQVRMVIQSDGTVSEVTVPQHHWSGHGSDQVESCIRERVLHWQFPTAQRGSTHEIQLIFGR